MKELIALSLLIGSTLVLGGCAPPDPVGDFGSFSEKADDTPTTSLEKGLDQMESEIKPSEGTAEQDQL